MSRSLTVNQRYILEQIVDLNETAYLANIIRNVKEVTGKHVSLGRAGDILQKMEHRQWVKGEIAHIEAEWTQFGGKPWKGKRCVKLYRVLPAGEMALGL